MKYEQGPPVKFAYLLVLIGGGLDGSLVGTGDGSQDDAILDEFEGRHRLDLVLLGRFGVLVHIHLRQSGVFGNGARGGGGGVIHEFTSEKKQLHIDYSSTHILSSYGIDNSQAGYIMYQGEKKQPTLLMQSSGKRPGTGLVLHVSTKKETTTLLMQSSVKIFALLCEY